MKYNFFISKISGIRDAYEKQMLHDVERLWHAKKEKELQNACSRYGESSLNHTRAMSDSIQKEYNIATIKREVPFWYDLQWRLNNIKAHISI